MLDHGNKSHRITMDQITNFAEALYMGEYGKGTIENYVRNIKALYTWCGGHLDRDGVIAWKAHLIRSNAPATVNAVLAGINCFFRFQRWIDCVVKPLRLQRHSFSAPERELSREEYTRLVRAAQKSGNERLALLMETICVTGIRVGEVGYITAEAAIDGRTEISMKGKVRTILIPQKLCRKLLHYARTQGVTSGALFLTRTNRSLSRTQIWAEMKKLCSAANVRKSKVFPHTLRHLFAKTYYRLYRDVVKLADILGHSSINTTRIYLLSDGTEHIRQLERMNLLC